MAKISMLVPDYVLRKIDAQSGGNRTAFMVSAALKLAREMERERIDRDILAALDGKDHIDEATSAHWDGTIGDGLKSSAVGRARRRVDR